MYNEYVLMYLLWYRVNRGQYRTSDTEFLFLD